MSALKQLYLFLTSSKTTNSYFSLGFLFQTRSLFYCLVIVYTLWISYIFPNLLNELQPVKLQEFVFGEHSILVFVLAVLLWPLMEELLFRAWMRRWWWNVSRALGAFIFAFVKYLTYDFIQSLNIDSQFIISCIGYGMYVICVILSFHLSKPFFPRISRLYSRYWMFIFWLLTLIFWLVHLSNYNISEWWYMLLFLIVPQILLWVMLWFVRMKRGLWFAIMLHMFHNAVQIIPLLILKKISWTSDVLTYVPNLSANTVYTNPRMLMNAIYMSMLFCFVLRNILRECKYLLYWDNQI